MGELETKIVLGLGIFFAVIDWVAVIYIEIHNHLKRKRQNEKISNNC